MLTMKEHFKRLETRFKWLKPQMIVDEDSTGRTEYIAATRDCMGHGGSNVSFEEIRRHHLPGE